MTHRSRGEPDESGWSRLVQILLSGPEGAYWRWLLGSDADGPAKVVSERLGHASVAFTLDTYAHVLPDQQRQAADLMDSLLPVPSRSAR